MDKDRAKTLIRRLANQGCVGFSKHCRDSMADRSVNSDDFLQVLMWGKILNVEENASTGHWKCKVKGKDIEGDDLTLLVAVDESRQWLSCVTVF